MFVSGFRVRVMCKKVGHDVFPRVRISFPPRFVSKVLQTMKGGWLMGASGCEKLVKFDCQLYRYQEIFQFKFSDYSSETFI
jgi:hypothetical protein